MESSVIGETFASGRRYVRYERMTKGDVELLLACTDKLAKDWTDVDYQ